MPVWNLLDLGRCLNMTPETHNSAAFRSIVQVVILSMLSMNIKRRVFKLLLSAEYHPGKSFVGPTGPREACWAKRGYDTPCTSEKEKEEKRDGHAEGAVAAADEVEQQSTAWYLKATTAT